MKKGKEQLKLKGKLRYTVFEKGTENVLYRSPFMPNNIVLNSGNGLNVLVRNFLGATSDSFEATACMIGTDATAPSDSDTALIAPEQNDTGNDLAVPRSTQAESGLDTAVVNFFFADDDLTASTEYKEFGVYVGGEATTTELTGGKLWSRLLLSPTYTHNGGDVKFEYQLSISK